MPETTYRHLAVDGAKPAPTREELLEIETLLGVSLPPDFVEFLNVANGGYIPYCITIGNESISFCSIYQSGLDVQGGYGLGTFVGEIVSARDYLSIPNGVLPFAEDGGGSCVFLDLSRGGKEV